MLAREKRTMWDYLECCRGLSLPDVLQGNKQALNKGQYLTVAWFLFPCHKATSYVLKFYGNSKSQACWYWILVVLGTCF